MPTALPAISVIVPAYGVAAFLGEALASLKDQDFRDWEAIVVDDGDGEVAGVAAPFLADPRFRLLATANGGVSRARNQGVAAARAPLIALLDGDDIYEPAYLSAMRAAIVADPAIGFVSCNARFFGDAREGRRFSDQMAQEPPVTLARVLAREFNVFTAAIMRREAFDAVGGYDESLCAGEDLDLWIRILEADWRGGYLPEPLARYRRRAGSLSWDTVPMLEAVVRLYASAAERNRDRPEAAIAESMREQSARRLEWETGEALIRAGRSREGVAMLARAGAGGRSLRWAAAMTVMRAAPGLARALIGFRERI